MAETLSITTYTASKMRDLFAMVVNHGADAAVARPAGIALVIWQGTVLPTNMGANDLFIDTSTSSLSGYVTQDEFDTQGPSGRELAYAESIVQQTSASGVQVNITGLEITFTVGSRPVYVEGYTPWAGGTAASTLGLAIRDGADTDLLYAGSAIPAAGVIASCRIEERIAVPGTYTRRLSFARSGGTGTVTNLLNLPSLKATLKATER